ncbi:MAG: tRNA (N(6)-L-threonylcarbamoyladenosine(37)-C(2))-methylthiotransferase MtaB [Clostridiales bacterium]|nr:tRNA (N(6)-L-threonylcarbamoyladenosine(37)-C(2))-methylthiotransferase MtaB [Clostridiales bacterium]
MKAAFYTLGCKVNQYETQAMAQLLERNGIETVDFNQPADIYVINSCTVTAESDRKSRSMVRSIKSKHPDSIVVLTGCMTQAMPSTGESLSEADIIIGNGNNEQLFDMISRYKTGDRIVNIVSHTKSEKYHGNTISDFYGRTRAEIKIEDGCNRFCTYCLIPYARGFVRSKPLETIKEECSLLASKGFKEIVLVGINLSAYGTESGEGLSIVDAVKCCAETPGVLRVRLGSLEPDHITDEIIEKLSKIPQLCPQFHISLQSGCDKTLKKMNRHYTAKEYYDLCLKLRNIFKGASITTDIMVGFPGETEEDFLQSVEFVKKIGFEKVHIFPYSRRPGTPAASYPDQVTNSVKSRRACEMASVCEKTRKERMSALIGRTVEVLTEESDGLTGHGYTKAYIPVKFKGECDAGIPVKIKITGIDEDSCTGELSV